MNKQLTQIFLNWIRTCLNSRRIVENIGQEWANKYLMCKSVYLYILTIRHYVPNTFLALPNLPNRQILANIYVKAEPHIHHFSENWRE